MPVSPTERAWLLRDVLREVSRAFYLSLWVLPRSVREPLGLAYLAARAADTIADTAALPPDQRALYLGKLQREIETGAAEDDWHERLCEAAANYQDHPGERRLLLCLHLVLEALNDLHPLDRAAAREVLATLTRGMQEDLARFPGALQTAAELDRYTYLVAGCVGPFWTEIIARHSKPLEDWDVPRMSALGERFGKALQLTNVLRDVPRDAKQGRCYLPAEELKRYGLKPEELTDPRNDLRARPILAKWLAAALEHYRAAEEYALSIPPRCTRLRLAVLWPILIGLATLARVARSHSWLDGEPIKVSRGWIYRTLLLSTLLSGSNRALQKWFDHLHTEAENALRMT